MKSEILSRFKTLFQEQRNALISSQNLVSDEFHMQKDEMLDETDWTSMELETNMKMRLRNRETLFLKKIDEALVRISEGRFGECEACEEEIDPKRLEARPTATLCVSCKEEQERTEQLHIDGHKHKSEGTKLKLA